MSGADDGLPAWEVEVEVLLGATDADCTCRLLLVLSSFLVARCCWDLTTMIGWSSLSYSSLPFLGREEGDVTTAGEDGADTLPIGVVRYGEAADSRLKLMLDTALLGSANDDDLVF